MWARGAGSGQSTPDELLGELPLETGKERMGICVAPSMETGKSNRRVVGNNMVKLALEKLRNGVMFRVRSRLAHRRPDRKVEIFIVGAQKAGTTALFEILSHHSEIAGAAIKETNYYGKGGDADSSAWNNVGGFFHRGAWKDHRLKLMEATPRYLSDPGSHEKIFAHNTNAKIIIILRNPAQRVLSAWTMYHAHFKTGRYEHYHDARPFAQVVKEELAAPGDAQSNPKGYVHRGLYLEQIQRYQKQFGQDQVIILENDDLRNDFDRVSRELQEFLGVQYEPLQPRQANQRRVQNRENYPEQMKQLYAFFEGPNHALFQALGRSYPWGPPEEPAKDATP